MVSQWTLAGVPFSGDALFYKLKSAFRNILVQKKHKYRRNRVMTRELIPAPWVGVCVFDFDLCK